MVSTVTFVTTTRIAARAELVWRLFHRAVSAFAAGIKADAEAAV